MVLMAYIIFGGIPLSTRGRIPKVGSTAPDFCLIKTDSSEIRLADLRRHKVVLNVFPSAGTDLGAFEVRRFNERVSHIPKVINLIISKDYPYVYRRYCNRDSIRNVTLLSACEDNSFEKAYGVSIDRGPLEGLLARAIFLIDEYGKIRYAEMVRDILDEPNYDFILTLLKSDRHHMNLSRTAGNF